MKPLSPELLAAIEESARRNARRTMEGYIRYTFPGFKFGWFNALLCRTLDKFYRDYEAGLNPRLMIFAPPRCGKTEAATRRFPAFSLGQNNKLNFIWSAYAASLAGKNSRDVMRIVESQKHASVFPDTRVPSPLLKAKEEVMNTRDEWEVVNRSGMLTSGSYRAAGVGGGINGMGFDIGGIDDPVKNYKEASSPVVQERIREWYETTFYTRRNPEKNGIIIIMTRWHTEDLAGYLVEKMRNGGEQFQIFSFPMLAEEDEYFTLDGVTYKTRNAGELLHPERMDAAFVKACQRNELTWNSLYQQNPTVKGGNFFKTEWFGQYQHPPKMIRKVITADTAQKKGQHNDYTVFQLWGLCDRGFIYLLDQVRAKMDAPELIDAAVNMWRRYGGGIKGPVVNASALHIEDKVSGTGLIQTLRKGGYTSNGELFKSIPCIPISRGPDQSKGTRAIDNQAILQSGQVLIPQNAPWITEYLMEFEQFNLDMTHPHDDQVDATMDAIDILLKGAGVGVNFAALT